MALSDATLDELISELESRIAEYGTNQPPAALVEQLAKARDARGLNAGGGGSGDGNPSTADTGLAPYDTLAEATTADPTANTAGTATVSYRMTGLLRWTVKLLQSIAGVAAGSTDAGYPVKIGGVYNTTKPTYTNGQRGNLEISSRGFLYIDAFDIVSTPNNINTADAASSTTAGANSQNIITGNPTNNSSVAVEVSGSSSFAVLITGTFVGTLQFERSLDNGTTYTSVGAFSAGTNFIAQTTTLPGAFHGNASSATHIRVRATAWTSGVASVRILAGQGTGTITVGNPIRLFDAVSGVQGTIKAASTQPLATDTAIVTTNRDRNDWNNATALVQTSASPTYSAPNTATNRYTVPAGKQWQILGVWVVYSTEASVGTRNLTLRIVDGTAGNTFRFLAGTTQTANQSRSYAFGVGLSDLTAFRSTEYLTTPIPPLVLPPGSRVDIFDNAAISTGDTVTAILYVMERSL